MAAIQFDETTGRVHSSGVEVMITEKEKLLMSVFVGAPDRVLTKDELLERVWPERAGSVEAGNLTQLVSKLRRSLRPAGLHASIVTCGRTGYKFVDGTDDPGACEGDDSACHSCRHLRRERLAARQVESLDASHERRGTQSRYSPLSTPAAGDALRLPGSRQGARLGVLPILGSAVVAGALAYWLIRKAK